MRKPLTRILGVAALAMFLSLIGLVLWQDQKGKSLERKLRETNAALQAETLTSAGWKETALRMKEVDLPNLQEQLKRAEEAGSEPLVRTRVVTKEVQVPVQVPVLVRSEGSLGETIADKSLPPSVGVSSDLQLAIDMTDDGKVFYTGKLFTHLSGELFPEGASIEQALDENAEVAVSEVVRKSLDYYRNRPRRFALAPRPLRHWRVGMGFGVAATLDQNGSVSLGPAVYFGVQM